MPRIKPTARSARARAKTDLTAEKKAQQILLSEVAEKNKIDMTCYIQTRIPAELRNTIYEYTLSSEYVLSDCSALPDQNVLSPYELAVNIALLCLNKKIHHEALPVFYECNKFAVYKANMPKVLNLPYFNRIRDLDIIGISSYDLPTIIENSLKLKGLRTLTLTATCSTSFLGYGGDWIDEGVPPFKIIKAQVGRVECVNFLEGVSVTLQWPEFVTSWNALANREVRTPRERHEEDVYSHLLSMRNCANYKSLVDYRFLKWFEKDPIQGIQKLRLKDRTADEIAEFSFDMGRAVTDILDNEENWGDFDGLGYAKRWTFKTDTCEGVENENESSEGSDPEGEDDRDEQIDYYLGQMELQGEIEEMSEEYTESDHHSEDE